MIEFEGELDMANAGVLSAAVTRERDAGHDVVIDLSKCGFLDSTAIHELIDISQDLKEEGGELVLVVPPEPAERRRLFEITGVDQQLRVYDSMGTAAVSLGGRNIKLHRATRTV